MDVTCPSSFSRSQAICGDNGQLSQVGHAQSRVVKAVRCICRGKSTCGDIDVMITRSPDDGRTHAGMFISRLRAVRKICSYSTGPLLGVLPRLLSVLHSTGILTEDLSLSSDANDNLECSYRGLCIRPVKLGQDNQPSIRRRIGMIRRLVTGPGRLIHHNHNRCLYRYTRRPLGESGRDVDIFHGASRRVVQDSSP